MGKVIDSLVQSALDTRNFSGVILAQLHFNPIIRYNSSYQTVYWDEDGGGDQAYLGLGHLASISVLTETNELAAQTIQLSISGIPNSAITDAFSDEYIGQPVYLYYATLDDTTYAVQGGQTGPILMFSGRMDFANIEFGETANITINVTNRLADWERARGGRFNEGYQRRKVDPNDTGFRYVQGIQNKPITWGAITLADPGGGGGGSDQDGDRSGPGGGYACFTGNTEITMSDGFKKYIKDIKVGNTVTTASGKVGKVLNVHQHIYSGDLIGINWRKPFMTTNHPIMLEDGWAAYDVEAAKEHIGEEVNKLIPGKFLKTPTGNIILDNVNKESVSNITVYNITVEGSTYIANGFKVHNK